MYMAFGDAASGARWERGPQRVTKSHEESNRAMVLLYDLVNCRLGCADVQDPPSALLRHVFGSLQGSASCLEGLRGFERLRSWQSKSILIPLVSSLLWRGFSVLLN